MSLSGDLRVGELRQIVSKTKKDLIVFGINPELIKLPQFILIGPQNNSNSRRSVLHNLIGVRFLSVEDAAASPFTIHLRHMPMLKGGPTEIQMPPWVEFGHLPNQQFYHLDTIQRELHSRLKSLKISAHERADASKNEMMTELSIFSDDAANFAIDLELNFIDQPGIFNKTEEIPQSLTKLVKTEDSLIVAVFDARNASENAKNFKLIRKVDPFGVKILLVVVLNDSNDAEATESVENAEVSLQRIKGSQNKESAFGIIKIPSPSQNSALINKIHLLLAKKINQNHSLIESKLKGTEARYKKELSLLEYPERDAQVKRSILFNIIASFMDRLRYQIFEIFLHKHKDKAKRVPLPNQQTKNKVRQIFAQALESLWPQAEADLISDHQIIKIKNKKQDLISFEALQMVLKTLIKKLEAPSIACVDLVYHQILKYFTSGHVASITERFPKILQAICSIMSLILKQVILKCRHDLHLFVQEQEQAISVPPASSKEMQMELVNILKEAPNKMPKETSKEFEIVKKKKEEICKGVRSVLRKYFERGIKKCGDYVLQCILYHFVSEDFISISRRELKLTSPEKVEELVKQSEVFVLHKEMIKAKLKTLEETFKSLEEVRKIADI